MKKCEKCGQEKADTKLRIVGRGTSDDPRLINKNDVLIQKFICDECANQFKKREA